MRCWQPASERDRERCRGSYDGGCIDQELCSARGVAKTISGSATFLGKAIRQTARDRDVTLEKFSHHVAGEVRALNSTLAAIAISDDHEGARSLSGGCRRAGHRGSLRADTSRGQVG